MFGDKITKLENKYTKSIGIIEDFAQQMVDAQENSDEILDEIATEQLRLASLEVKTKKFNNFAKNLLKACKFKAE